MHCDTIQSSSIFRFARFRSASLRDYTSHDGERGNEIASSEREKEADVQRPIDKFMNFPWTKLLSTSANRNTNRSYLSQYNDVSISLAFARLAGRKVKDETTHQYQQTHLRISDNDNRIPSPSADNERTHHVCTQYLQNCNSKSARISRDEAMDVLMDLMDVGE